MTDHAHGHPLPAGPGHRLSGSFGDADLEDAVDASDMEYDLWRRDPTQYEAVVRERGERRRAERSRG